MEEVVKARLEVGLRDTVGTIEGSNVLGRASSNLYIIVVGGEL